MVPIESQGCDGRRIQSGRWRRGDGVRLTYSTEVEAFRAEFSAWLDANLPDEADTSVRPPVERRRPGLGPGLPAPHVR